MKATQRTTLEMFKQVETFIDSNPIVLANAPTGYAEQVQAFKTALGLIEQVAADRGSGTANKAAEQRRALRHALRVGQLHPLRKIARVLERTVVGMPHLVNLPKKVVSTQGLLDAAKAAARDVAPYQAQFISKGMPADFLDQLNQAIQGVQDANTAAVAAKQNSVSARGQLQIAMQEARDAVTCLDLIIRRACDADPVHGSGTLAVWNGIVPPPARVNRQPSNAASGTTADVSGSGGGTPPGQGAGGGDTTSSGTTSSGTTGSGTTGNGATAGDTATGGTSGTGASDGTASTGTGATPPGGGATPTA